MLIKSNLGKERVRGRHEVNAAAQVGIWRQEMKESPLRLFLIAFFLMACSACHLIQLRTICPGVAPSTVLSGLPTSTIIQEDDVPTVLQCFTLLPF